MHRGGRYSAGKLRASVSAAAGSSVRQAEDQSWDVFIEQMCNKCSQTSQLQRSTMGKKVEAMTFWGNAEGLIPSRDLLQLTPGMSLLAGIKTLPKPIENSRDADDSPITEQ